MILSLVLMLEWLAERHGGGPFAAAAAAYADGTRVPFEADGTAGAAAILTHILDNL